ncbi:MAG: DUF5677 domain-containing protein [Bacilli bacterium]
MSNFYNSHSKVDIILLKRLIESALEIYAKLISIPANHLTTYVRSEIANASRMAYFYMIKDLKNDQQKLTRCTNEEINKYAEYCIRVYREIVESRHSSTKKGMDMYSSLSFSLESTIIYLINAIKPLSKSNPLETLIPDLFLKFFKQSLGLLRMLNLDLASEAYSSWRTLHEAECVIKLLVEGGEPLQKVYLRHLIYNNAFRHSITNKAESDKIFDELKTKMKSHDLKSKDMKKFIEYGWLYACKDYHEEDKEFKLNFRNGLQKAAGLEEYNQWYEMASELIHSSPIFFYANNSFFLDITTVNLSDIVLRAVGYFNEYVIKENVTIEKSDIIKDMLIENLKHYAEKQDDSFYTKYKDYLTEDDDDDENESTSENKQNKAK